MCTTRFIVLSFIILLGVSGRQMNKRKKGIFGKIKHVTPTKPSKKNRK